MSLKHFYDFLYDGSHVVVLILGKATTEDDVLLLGSFSAILVGECIIGCIVDGVVGLHAILVLGRILLTDNCLGVVIDLLAEHLEMFMLNDTGVGDIMGSVVDYRVALIVGRILYAGLERDGSPIQLTELVGEEFI